MKQSLTFDDVLIVPQFSTVSTRKDIYVKTEVMGQTLFPVISSNMDTVTEASMAKAMYNYGSQGCLHRFQSIEDNIRMYQASESNTWVSIGVGKEELDRAYALYDSGARQFVLDVAHGANMNVVKQVQLLQEFVGGSHICVGNFATGRSIKDFVHHLGSKNYVDTFKVGIGGGSACLTRYVTGCGMPTFSSIVDCVQTGYNIIADGGIRSSGDFSKALAAGAKAVMVGGMLAGANESPGELIVNERGSFKKYRGSASQESYEAQNKTASHRTPEGDSFLVPSTGPVKNKLQELEAGLRSSMSYTGSEDLDEFKFNSEFVQVSTSGQIENLAHGKERK